MNALVQEVNARDVAPNQIWIWWLGQEGFVVKSPSRIVYIDPYLSTFAERTTRGQVNEHVRINPAPMRPEDVGHADVVLCTHDHADHIDPDGIPVIARESGGACFVVPECARQTMLDFGISPDRVHTLKGDDSLDVRGVRVHAVPAKHEAFDKDPERGYPYLSYLIGIEGLTLFHAGDTIPYPGQAERVYAHAVDAAFLPINGRDAFRRSLQFEGNFTCEEAVGFALAVRSRLTVPMHYDTFTLNTADVTEFCRIADHRRLRYAVMKIGGSLCLPAGEQA